MSRAGGELDSGESIDAEAGLEFDPSLFFWWAPMTAGLAKPVACEHRCSAARMCTCSHSGFSNHSSSVISLASIGSNLWKPPHFKNSLASDLFGLAGMKALVLGTVEKSTPMIYEIFRC